MNDLALRIVNLRESKDWSQAELARRLNLNKSTMNRIERGERKVSAEELEQLSDLFQVTTDFLLGRNNTPEWATKNEVIELDKILASKVGMSYGDEGEFTEEDRDQINDLVASYFWRKKQKENRGSSDRK